MNRFESVIIKDDGIYFSFENNLKKEESNNKELIVENEIQIEKNEKLISKNNKIDYTDTTFVIAFHYDTPDRLENLYLVINNLYEKTNSKIYVKEMGEKRYFDWCYNEEFSSVFRYDYWKSEFCKTKLLNSMVANIDTKFFFMCDVDIILTEQQLIETRKYMNMNIFGAIIPYNGLYYEVPRVYIGCIRDGIFIENLKDNFSYRFSNKDYLGTGASVCFDREKFIKIGMMNENFTKWGLEDDEVIYRMHILGQNVLRLNDVGPIYHLEHRTIRDDFGYGHTHPNADKQKKEFDKVKCYVNVQNYVDSWPWKI